MGHSGNYLLLTLFGAEIVTPDREGQDNGSCQQARYLR
jgi:hypothetical protein